MKKLIALIVIAGIGAGCGLAARRITTSTTTAAARSTVIPPSQAPPTAEPVCYRPQNVGNGVTDCTPKTPGQCPPGFRPNADGGVVCVSYSAATRQQPDSPPPTTLACGSVGPAVGTYNADKNDCTYRWPSGFTIDSPSGAVLQSYQTGGIGSAGYRACDVLYWSNGTTTHAC